MSDGTAIEWTDMIWNVVNGCTVVSPGCKHCYAMKQAHRFPVRRGLTERTAGGMVWTGEVRFNEKVLLDPMRLKRPRKIFVCAHGDLFYEKVPNLWIDQVFAVMAAAPQHVFQVLTKRPDRLREYAAEAMGCGEHWLAHVERSHAPMWPLPNVWLGTSVEDQKRADERIPILLDTPAALRWLSCEPLLGPVDLRAFGMDIHHHPDNSIDHPSMPALLRAVREKVGFQCVDWVVAGGESGPGARPMHPDWARALREQCAAAGVPFLFKQWGNWAPNCLCDTERAHRDTPRPTPGKPGCMFHCGKKAAGRLLDGVQHDGYPA